MKTVKLFALTILMLTFIGSSKMNAQTTDEEYNYITKGYKVQMESGLDMKKGYSFVELGNWGMDHSPEKRECTFKGLVRQGQTKPCAIMLIYKRTDISNGAVWYICIPTIDASAQWQKTLDFINQNFKSNDKMSNTIIWALMKFASQQTTK